MKMFMQMHLGLRLGLLVPLAVLCLSAPRANADTTLLTSLNMVTGSQSALYSFDAPSAGTLTAQLKNIDWPSTPIGGLSDLSFTASTASGVITSWSTLTSHTESFQVTPGTYFAHIMATATGSLGVGLYALTVSFSPSAVPLPASEWMLLVGVLVLFGLTRALSAFAPLGMLHPRRTAEG
jgi:hypothetical protein